MFNADNYETGNVTNINGFPLLEWGPGLLDNVVILNKDNLENTNYQTESYISGKLQLKIIHDTRNTSLIPSTVKKIKNSLDKWSSVITNTPEGQDILTYFFVEDLGAPDENDGGILADSRLVFTVSNNTYVGRIIFNSYFISDYNNPNSTLINSTFLHEMGHIFGIGSLWEENNLLSTNYVSNTGTEHQLYLGTSANQFYNYFGTASKQLSGVNTNYSNSIYEYTPNCIGIPIENNGGEGTALSHPEEGAENINGEDSTNNIVINNVYYPGLGNELMTGISESNANNIKMSAITLGFLEDLNYQVNYSQAEEFNLGTSEGGDSIYYINLKTSFNVTITANPSGSGNVYLLNDDTVFIDRKKYLVTTGTYTFNTVPDEHPIAFITDQTSEQSKISYTNNENGLILTKDGRNYYSGQVVLTINEEFSGTLSGDCHIHGAMGLQNKFSYGQNGTSQ